MIRWNNDLDFFIIDPLAPVARRRAFAMEKAKLEALRFVAEDVEELAEALQGDTKLLSEPLTFKYDANEYFNQREWPGRPDDDVVSVLKLAQVDAMQAIARELRRYRVVFQVRHESDFVERDVANMAVDAFDDEKDAPRGRLRRPRALLSPDVVDAEVIRSDLDEEVSDDDEE